MKELKENINLHCVFCKSSLFALPYAGYRPHHGSFIVCANCGRENDFTSLTFVARAKIEKITTACMEEAREKAGQQLQNFFHGNKVITIR